MTLETERVTEVFAPHADGRGGFGSGYFVADGLVLTAGHLVDGARGHCEVRALGTKEWQRAEPAWRGGSSDAAVLQVLGATRGDAGVVRFGRLATDRRARCRALGFPAAQTKQLGPRAIRDTEEIAGEIVPRSSRKSTMLTVQIGGSIPVAVGTGSPWEGMSGAAVFSGPLLVGIVSVSPVARFGSGRLEAVPVAEMVNDAGFRDAFGLARPWLEAVEDVVAAEGVLRAPYRALPANPPPSLLLRSTYNAVPFRRRREELGDLRRWCDGEAELAVALVTGVGGTGKTRLAAELCFAQTGNGWLCGFLEPGATPEQISQLASAASDVLVVVDYAETRLSDVRALLAVLARPDGPRRGRAVLVARGVGDWWVGLPQRDASPAIELALKSTLVLPLGPLERTVEGRREAYDDAVAHLAGHLAQETPTHVVEPDFSDPAYANALFIQMAALTALEPHDEALLDTDRLLAASLEREVEYWHAAASANGLTEIDRHLLRRAVAVATLSRAANEEEASATLAAVPDLASEGDERQRRRIARWLRDLYPGEGWFRPLEPDRLGEALIAAVLADVPGFASTLLARSSPTQAEQTLTVLTRAARNHGTAEEALEAALLEHLVALWRPALSVAGSTGEPIGHLLGRAVDESAPSGLADEIAAVIPRQTVALSELAVLTESKALEEYLAGASGADLAENARRFDAISRRFAAAGLTDHAVSASRQAVVLRRKLARKDRDGTARHELARSLVNLAKHLARVDLHEEALAAVEEAIAIMGDLPEHEAEDTPLLVAALTGASSYFRALDRDIEAAIRFAQGAVNNARVLVEVEQNEGQVPLVEALGELSASLGVAGRYEVGLAACDEAIAILISLSADDTDSLRPHLADAHRDRSVHLLNLERAADAIAAIRESVDVYRELTRFSSAYEYALSDKLRLLAEVLATDGQHDQALSAAEESVDRLRAAPTPDFALARALRTYAARLGEAGRDDDALAAAREAVAAYGPRGRIAPAADFERIEAVYDLARRLSAMGREDEANDLEMNPLAFLDAVEGQSDFADIPGQQRQAHTWVVAGRWETLVRLPQRFAGGRFREPVGAEIRVRYGFGPFGFGGQVQTLDGEERRLWVGAGAYLRARLQIRVPSHSGYVEWAYVGAPGTVPDRPRSYLSFTPPWADPDDEVVETPDEPEREP